MFTVLSSIFSLRSARNHLLSSRPIIAVLIALAASCSPTIPDGPVISPTPDAVAMNQIPINRNGCGPVSLINAYKFGSPKWNQGYQKMQGDSDPAKFQDLVRKFGIHISRHNGMVRWDRRAGINSLDLTDLANQFQRTRKTNLPPLKLNTLFVRPQESHAQLLHRAHRQLRDSLLRGFPPILSVKRFVQRPNGNSSVWKQLHGHFVVLHEIPGRIPKDATSFQIKYIDPWGGVIKTGTIKIPKTGFFSLDSTNQNPKFRRSPTLEINFPQSSLGKNLLRKGEKSATILASSINPQ